MQRIISIIILITFLATSVKSPAYAQALPSNSLPPAGRVREGVILPTPGQMLHLSPDFTPAHLVGMTIDPTNALKFNFLIDRGDATLSEAQRKAEYSKLVKYFLASLTVPDTDQWVNLSPYEKNRIIQDDFGDTQMGRDLLAQDYILKQLTSSLIYPESKLGKEFWDKVYAKAWTQYHTTEVPVNTFNKVWIIPDEAAVYESGNTVYVLRDHLKVMLEEDYLSLKNHSVKRLEPYFPGHRSVASLRGAFFATKQSNTTNTSNDIGSQIIRQIILPQLEREVNEGKNFANLRQIYSGMILATWYKHALKASLLGKIYADRAKVQGVTGFNSTDPTVIASFAKQSQQQIYQQYLKAFKKGVFNYIKEDVDKYTQQPVDRKYFSGGTKDFSEVAQAPADYALGRLLIVDASNPIPSHIDFAAIANSSQEIDRASIALNTTTEEDRASQSPNAAMIRPQIKREVLALIRKWNKLGEIMKDRGVKWIDDRSGKFFINSENSQNLQAQMLNDNSEAMGEFYLYLMLNPNYIIRKEIVELLLEKHEKKLDISVAKLMNHLIDPMQSIRNFGTPQMPLDETFIEETASQNKRKAIVAIIAMQINSNHRHKFLKGFQYYADLQNALLKQLDEWDAREPQRMEYIKRIVRENPALAGGIINSNNFWDILIVQLLQYVITKRVSKRTEKRTFDDLLFEVTKNLADAFNWDDQFIIDKAIEEFEQDAQGSKAMTVTPADLKKIKKTVFDTAGYEFFYRKWGTLIAASKPDSFLYKAALGELKYRVRKTSRSVDKILKDPVIVRTMISHIVEISQNALFTPEQTRFIKSTVLWVEGDFEKAFEVNAGYEREYIFPDDARRFIEALRTDQPEGPYYIAKLELHETSGSQWVEKAIRQKIVYLQHIAACPSAAMLATTTTKNNSVQGTRLLSTGEAGVDVHLGSGEMKQVSISVLEDLKRDYDSYDFKVRRDAQGQLFYTLPSSEEKSFTSSLNLRPPSLARSIEIIPTTEGTVQIKLLEGGDVYVNERVQMLLNEGGSLQLTLTDPDSLHRETYTIERQGTEYRYREIDTTVWKEMPGQFNGKYGLFNVELLPNENGFWVRNLNKGGLDIQSDQVALPKWIVGGFVAVVAIVAAAITWHNDVISKTPIEIFKTFNKQAINNVEKDFKQYEQVPAISGNVFNEEMRTNIISTLQSSNANQIAAVVHNRAALKWLVEQSLEVTTNLAEKGYISVLGDWPRLTVGSTTVPPTAEADQKTLNTAGDLLSIEIQSPNPDTELLDEIYNSQVVSGARRAVMVKEIKNVAWVEKELQAHPFTEAVRQSLFNTALPADVKTALFNEHTEEVEGAGYNYLMTLAMDTNTPPAILKALVVQYQEPEAQLKADEETDKQNAQQAMDQYPNGDLPPAYRQLIIGGYIPHHNGYIAKQAADTLKAQGTNQAMLNPDQLAAPDTLVIPQDIVFKPELAQGEVAAKIMKYERDFKFIEALVIYKFIFQATYIDNNTFTIAIDSKSFQRADLNIPRDDFIAILEYFSFPGQYFVHRTVQKTLYRDKDDWEVSMRVTYKEIISKLQAKKKLQALALAGNKVIATKDRFGLAGVGRSLLLGDGSRLMVKYNGDKQSTRLEFSAGLRATQILNAEVKGKELSLPAAKFIEILSKASDDDRNWKDRAMTSERTAADANLQQYFERLHRLRARASGEVKGKAANGQEFPVSFTDTVADIQKKYDMVMERHVKTPATPAANQPRQSAAMKAQAAPFGGIDLNSANLNLEIKRDGRGVPLPLAQQDMAQLSRIQGFIPEILEIKPAGRLPIISELQQKLQATSV